MLVPSSVVATSSRSGIKYHDRVFYEKADLMHEWMIIHNRFPSAKSSKSLCKSVEHSHGSFLRAQRRYFQGFIKKDRPVLTLQLERIVYLKSIHHQIFQVYKKNRDLQFLPVLNEKHWESIFQHFQLSQKKNDISKSDYCFSFASKRPYVGEKSESYKEHMIRSFGITFPPSHCSPTAPKGTMQHICSYMFISGRLHCQPTFMKKNNAVAQKVSIKNIQITTKYNHVYSSSYFPPNTVPLSLQMIGEVALYTVLPQDMFAELHSASSREDIVSVIVRNEYALDTFFFWCWRESWLYRIDQYG